MPDHDMLLKQQYIHLSRRSRRLRADGIYEEALANHRLCLKIAREIQDDIRIASSHFWMGECLYQLGRKEEALMVLTPNLATAAKGSPDDLYNSMTKYIIIALDMPSNKQQIVEAIDLTWSYLRRIGRLDWKHKLLYLEAELYQMEGKRELALSRAIEAWAAWRDEYPLFVADAHFYQITMFQLRLKLAEDAARTITDWEGNDSNAFPNYRRSVLGRSRSYLSRLHGKYRESILHAEESVYLTEQMHTPESLATMRVVLSWALMLNGEFERPRQLLQQIPYEIIKRKAVTIADYHLTKARSLLGLPPVDIVLERSFPDAPDSLTASDEIRHELRRARRMYQVSLKRARLFDEAFECSWRQDEINDCVAHIDALENAMSL